MEEITDFDKWLTEQQTVSLEYYAVYDPETGIITGIYPQQIAETESFKVSINHELADSLFNGRINSNQCIVDIETGAIEIVETTDLTKIDHILHRVIEKKYSKTDNFDVHITYDRDNAKLIFELSIRVGGTYVDNTESNKKKVSWDKNTVIDFLLTTYNDPNVLIEVMSFNISDMIGHSKVFDNIILPKRFSIFYTNRILKNYVFIEL
jgi:hypothetical protein